MTEQTKYKMVPLNPEKPGGVLQAFWDHAMIGYKFVLAAAPDASPCIWTHDENEYCDKWDSACGESWSFIEGGPAENNVRFCHGCGRLVCLDE